MVNNRIPVGFTEMDRLYKSGFKMGALEGSEMLRVRPTGGREVEVRYIKDETGVKVLAVLGGKTKMPMTISAMTQFEIAEAIREALDKKE